ncbi:crossover junction endodeoxyribonuclease RuvC [bacterium]|nr:crossover junction endodeoxyribonuclease RuvC [bacterium]
MGIDPGYHRCGFAVFEQLRGETGRLLTSGTIVTDRQDTAPARLHYLALEMNRLIGEWKPDVLAVEKLYFSKNVKTAIGVAQARGVILASSAAAGVVVAEYTPTMVKSQLTGNGRAGKEQVAYMVKRLLGLNDSERLDDEMDAAAIALCHSQRASIPEVLK